MTENIQDNHLEEETPQHVFEESVSETENEGSISFHEDEYKELSLQETEFLIDEDPDLGRNYYHEPLFFTRGFRQKPTAYEPVDHKERASCSKHFVHDWLHNIKPAAGLGMWNIVEVQLKNGRKDFFMLPDGLEISEGDVVAVESNAGHDMGVVSLTGELCRIQMKKQKVSPDLSSMKKLYRRAKPSDIDKWESVIALENKTLFAARKVVSELGLSMKLNDVEYQGNGTKAIFYYTADTRVDFRELIKRLADMFHIRIEMRQIGIRQEACKLGGIGVCGREFCCSMWINNFHSVTTHSARVQQLAQNPQKLAGQCGKLKCCLNFEYDAYAEQLKEFPPAGVALHTEKGKAIYHKMEVFRKVMWYSYEGETELLPISCENVAKIIEMNKKKQFPSSLEDYVVSDNTANEQRPVDFTRKKKRR